MHISRTAQFDAPQDSKETFAQFMVGMKRTVAKEM